MAVAWQAALWCCLRGDVCEGEGDAVIYAVCFFVLGFVLAFGLTPLAMRLSRRGIGLDDPNETRKKHSAPISRLGGLPIMLSVTVGLTVILSMQPEHSTKWMPIMVGSVLMYGIGFWDDLKRLGAKKKLACQILTACLVYWMGLAIDKVTYPGGGWSVDLTGGMSFAVTVFWLIAVPNIINLIDGFDGLAGGLGVFMSITLGVVAAMNAQVAVAWYAFTMAGACLGFLVFNFPPARIYLGDGGAYLIGFTIASLSLTSSHKASVAAVLLVTIVALGLPILDTVFAIARRAMRGFPLFSADDEHIHHRLERLGLDKRHILFGLYGIAVVLSLLALSIIWTQGRTLPIGIGVIFLLAIVALRTFHTMRSVKDVVRQTNRVLGRRREVQYALLQAKVLELELDRCNSAEEFWPVFQDTMRRVGFREEGQMEGDVEIRVRYNGSTPWTLHAPRSKATRGEWQRIAECFRPVYAKAKEKWGRQNGG